MDRTRTACEPLNRKILLALLTVSLATAHAELRIGIIGSDTSHVPAFTQILNDPTHPKHIPGGHK